MSIIQVPNIKVTITTHFIYFIWSSDYDLVCSLGSRSSNWQDFMDANWGTPKAHQAINLTAGNTLENKDECWNLAKQNVQNAIGIYLNYAGPYCRAINDATSLMPWPSSFPDNQDKDTLCILRSHIQGGRLKYSTTTF